MDPQETLAAVRAELKTRFVERDELIDLAATAVVARKHAVLLGPPGSAKSELIRALCERISGATYFQWLLTKFSTPEEVFGPVSLAGLEQDRYTRVIRGKLPEAQIAFIDELFKSNSAMLNALLPVLNERVFFDDGQPKAIPLLALFGASNELPESEELAALYDRLLVRYVVKYVEADGAFTKMLTDRLAGGNGIASGLIPLDDLLVLQSRVPAVEMSGAVIQNLLDLRKALKKDGIVVSDRRCVEALTLLQASAVVEGRTRVGQDDLTLLQHVFWQTPDQRQVVARHVLTFSNPYEGQAQELYDAAAEVKAKALEAKATEAGVEANAKLKKAILQLKELEGKAAAEGRGVRTIAGLRAKVEAFNREVLKECLGLAPNGG